MLDLTAVMLHDVTRVTLDVPERRLAWKPLPQTLICRVKVSIWKRGFFFSLCMSHFPSARRDGPAALICELRVLNAY